MPGRNKGLDPFFDSTYGTLRSIGDSLKELKTSGKIALLAAGDLADFLLEGIDNLSQYFTLL